MTTSNDNIFTLKEGKYLCISSFGQAVLNRVWRRTRDNPVTASGKMEKDLGTVQRKISDVVKQLRLHGLPIGSGNDGFYQMTSKQDAEDTLEFVENKNRGILVTIDVLRGFVDKFSDED